jgi:hypothetical protein
MRLSNGQSIQTRITKVTSVSIKAIFTLRITTDFNSLVDKGKLIMYWCWGYALVRIERNVVKFCSAFTHLNCDSVGSSPGDLVGVTSRQLVPPRRFSM